MPEDRNTSANAAALDSLRQWMQDAEYITFLTGAGMSTESGVPDFRSPTGIYATVREDVFDIETFRRQPEHFYAFARSFYAALHAAKPHAGHHAIARLAQQRNKRVTVATQNIDLLHQQAGSPVVFPVHGNLQYSICQQCSSVVETATLQEQIIAGKIPRHHCGGVFKPDIVFFGEELPEPIFRGARTAVSIAQLLVIAGTSLTVYPAAGLPDFCMPGCRIVIINHTPTPLDQRADLVLRASIRDTLAAVVP